VQVVGIRRVRSPLGIELAQPIEQGIGAPLRRGRSRPQDLEDAMIYSFSLSASFSYYLVHNVGFYVVEEKYWGRSPLLGRLAACTRR
jgi:hypothetical protein